MIDGLSLVAHWDIRGSIGRDCVDCDERNALEVVAGTTSGAVSTLASSPPRTGKSVIIER